MVLKKEVLENKCLRIVPNSGLTQAMWNFKGTNDCSVSLFHGHWLKSKLLKYVRSVERRIPQEMYEACYHL
jgi:hypothetical protein